jgi:ankyrin repeat protein
MNEMRSFFSRALSSRMRRHGVAVIAALAWSGFAFAGELHEAAKTGDPDKVKALLKANADLVSSRDSRGDTARLIAAKFGHRDIAAYLLANKADVNAVGKDETFSGPGVPGMALGGTPLGWAAQRNDLAMVELLLTNKANVNAKDGLGQTPLFWAVHGGRD